MSKEPKRNMYVGHRYVPKIMGEWDKAETYEGLSIVTNKGTSYTSKKRVPKGIDILNEEYWVVTGNYNTQIEEYRKDVREMEKEVGKKSDQSYVDNLNKKVTTQLAQTVEKKIFYDNIVTKKYRYNHETDYYITEIPSTIQLRVGVANDKLGSVQSTLDFARDKKATLAFNAGVFNMETNIPLGIVIKDGEIIKDDVYKNNRNAEVLTINKEGVLYSYDSETTKASELLDKGIVQAVQGWWPFIINGKYHNQRDPEERHPVQAIGQKLNGDYVLLTTDGRTQYDKGLNIDDAVEIMLSYDVDFAYNLDGGGSTSTVNKLIKQNKNIDKYTNDREVSTFLYFSKEVDDNNVFDGFSEIAKLKQEINEKITNLKNIESSFLFLKGKKGNFFPGIEFYVDGAAERSGKFRMTDKFVEMTHRDYDTDEKEKIVFKANKEGLFDVNGKLANIYSEPTLILDCDKTTETGFFKTSKDTLNTPVKQFHGYLINFRYTFELDDMSSVQLFVGKDTEAIFYRSLKSNGSSTGWLNFSSPATSTEYRPSSDVVLAGFTMFDKTLKKPIWWTGSKWVDSEGNEV